jgi:hypothetical protein
MNGRPKSLRSAVPWALTLALLASRLDSVPALSDPVTGSVSPSLHLSTPILYLLLAPPFTLWDGISMLSMSRLQGFLRGLLVLYLLWRLAHFIRVQPPLGSWKLWGRELAVLVASVVTLILFLCLGAVWHRPMLALAGTSPKDLVVDFHSHTNLSHDVSDTWMRNFDIAANLRWHSRAGFDAVFVTDHNVASRQSGEAGLCPGIEVSAWQSHIVLLGDTLPVDRDLYSRSLSGLLNLLRSSESEYGSLTLASLPEYRRNHWGRLDTLIAAGLDGFEIVNASPKANELTRSERERVVDLARKHDLFVVGVSDSHGWGATSMVWNLVRVTPADPAGATCSRILNQLRSGFDAVRVIERHRLRPDSGWPMWLTTIGMLWETWRSMSPELTLSWLLWVWLVRAGGILLRSRARGVKIAGRPKSHSQ